MGDYEHYYGNLPWMAPHKIVVRRDASWTQNRERQYFLMPVKTAVNWAVNLSRVRPAWRTWYRGEPHDRKLYIPVGEKPGARGHLHELNRQYSWLKQSKYNSLVEYVKASMGLDLEDVKRIAPTWYLKYLKTEATRLTAAMWKGLPEAIKEELKSPRYRLLYENNVITGRHPEL